MIQRIRINAYQVGLVFAYNKLVSVIEEGNYWIWGRKEVIVYEMKQSFVSTIDINILLQNEALAKMLEVVEVGDNEIVLVFQNGIFKEVLNTGRYAFWKGYLDYKFVKADVSKVHITEQINFGLLEHIKVQQYIRKFQVMNYEKALLFVN